MLDFASVLFIYLFIYSDAVSNVETDVEAKKVTVTSTLSSDELLEALQKTGKPVNFLGQKMW